MPDLGVFMISPHGMVLTWNAGAVRITGHRPEDMIGQPYARLHPAGDDEQAAAASRAELEAARTQGRLQQEGWRLRQDGHRFWGGTSLTTIRDGRGRLHGYAAVLRDLTERRRADDLLAVLDAAIDPILALTGDGVVTFANVAARKAFGRRRDRLVGMDVTALIPGLAGEPLDVTTRGLEVDAQRSDGSQFAAEVSLASVRTARGRVMTATVRDVTERVAAAQSLQIYGARFRAMFEQSPVGQLEVQLDSTVVRANRALETMLGAAPGELVGRSWRDILQPADERETTLEVAALLGAGGDYYESEHSLIAVDGRRVPARVAGAVVRDPQGRPLMLAAVAVDNSERDRARQALERREAEARATLDSLKGVLAATTEQAIVVTDATGRISFCNRGLELLLGYQPQALLGRPTSVLHDPAELRRITLALAADGGDRDPALDQLRLAAGGPPRCWTYLTGGGDPVVVDVVVTAVGDPFEPSGHVLVIRPREAGREPAVARNAVLTPAG
jgi:PAS domain S-box-containing protein